MDTIDYLQIAAIVLGIPLALGALMAFALVSSVKAMAGPDFKLIPADEKKHRNKFAAAAAHHDWADAQGFEWIGGFLIKSPQEIFVAAWQQPEKPRYFCIYSHQANDYYDFVTMFDGEESLTTSGTKDAHTLPQPPGKWVQSFHGADHERLWEEHVRAEKYLRKTEGLRLHPRPSEFQPLVTRAVRGQMAHVQSIPLWQIRGVFWYLTRGSKTNRPIAPEE